MSKPTCTNSPTSSSVWDSISSGQLRRARQDVGSRGLAKKHNGTQRDGGYKSGVTEFCRSLSSYLSQDIYCGGYSGEDPPLPIPNREVKLTIADGTAPPGGRVGSCHFLIRSPRHQRCRGLFAYKKAAEFNPQSSSTTAPRGISALPGPVTS